MYVIAGAPLESALGFLSFIVAIGAAALIWIGLSLHRLVKLKDGKNNQI